MNHTNTNTAGAAGYVPNTGFSGVCGGGGGLTVVPQFKAVANSTVNVTFPSLPSDIQPPFNIGQCFVHQGKTFGKNTAVDLGGGTTLNDTSFTWHVAQVGFQADGVTTAVAVVGDSVIWSIVPQNFNSSADPSAFNQNIPYWISGNYTITDVNGSTVNPNGAASPKRTSSRIQLFAGVAVTALIIGSCVL